MGSRVNTSRPQIGKNVIVIKPQIGYQMTALSSSADIVIGGGAAGS